MNRLHVVYQPQGLVYPRREGMISQAATNQVAYEGTDAAARLKRKALSGLAQLCKGVDTTLLPHSRTEELARLVEIECEKRGSYTRTATLDEAKNAVISALVTMASAKDKDRAQVYLHMVQAATVLFIDATKSTKPTKYSLVEEEEVVTKAMGRESEGSFEE